MISILNLIMAIVLLVLACLWYREGHIAKLSLAAQATRIVVITLAILGVVTLARPFAAEFLPTAVPAIEGVGPTIAWALRTFVGILLLALVVTTARTRRNGRWRNDRRLEEPWNRSLE